MFWLGLGIGYLGALVIFIIILALCRAAAAGDEQIEKRSYTVVHRVAKGKNKEI
jgi:hypothetical protein